MFFLPGFFFLFSGSRKVFYDEEDTLEVVKKSPKPLKKIDENERFARLTALSLEVPFSVKADDKAVVSFPDEEPIGKCFFSNHQIVLKSFF